MVLINHSQVGRRKTGERDLRFGLLVRAFVVLQGDLHSKQVSLSARGILHHPKSDVLLTKCLVASLCLSRFTGIIVIIYIVCIVPGLRSVVVCVV
jgi:hypothetical protein